MDPVSLARGHLQARRFDQARRAAEKILAKEPESVQAHRILAETAQQQGHLEQALVLYGHAAQLAPGDAMLLSNLGLVGRQLGRYDEALGAYHQLAALHPADANIQSKLALTHFERAERLFDGVPRQGTDIDAATDLATAKAYFERALELKPDFGRARRAIAVCHLGLNEIYEACLRGVDYIKRHPEDQEFPPGYADFPVRMLLAKALRESPESVPDLGDAARSATEVAIAAIRKHVTSDITGPAIVFYHVDIGTKHPFLGTAEGADTKKVDYLAMLAASARCARLTQPGAKIILLTDEATQLPDSSVADYVIRLPRAPEHLMYARMCGYRALVMSELLKGPILFLDTDLCLNRDFTPVFDGSFDIGLGYRSSIRWPLMPINEGLILAAPQRPAAAIRFFDTCVRLYDWLAEQPIVKSRYPFDARYWRGGQIALAAFAHWQVPPNSPEVVEIDSVRCRFLPCHFYNRAVMPEDTFADLDDAWGLHFKGLVAKSKMDEHMRRIQTRRK